jgi:hypothetical protein
MLPTDAGDWYYVDGKGDGSEYGGSEYGYGGGSMMGSMMGMMGSKGMMGMMGSKGSKGYYGYEARVPCEMTLFTTEVPTVVLADPDNPFGTPGDRALYSQPIFCGTEESPNEVGIVVGACEIIQPGVTGTCSMTVYYDDGHIVGGFSYTGALFDPIPSTNPELGDFNVIGTRGHFSIYPGGVVSTHVNEAGTLFIVPNFCVDIVSGSSSAYGY